MGSETFDLAIVGSGPVGIALARRLAGSLLSIVLVEAGSEKHDKQAEAQALRADRKTPDIHPEAHFYRRRMLGGTSTVWGGRCIMFDALDFEDNVLRAGWPIGKADVDPYVAGALAFLEAGAERFDETAFAEPIVWGRLESGLDADQAERFSCPTDVWQRYRRELADQSNLTVRRNTVVTQIAVDAESGLVTGLKTADAASGGAGSIAARRVVIAGGGIETARLLLASRDAGGAGLGNASGLVGRNYMTHLLGDVGTMHFASQFPDAKLDYRWSADRIYARTVFKLTERVRREKALPNVLWRPSTAPVWDPAHRSAILSAMHFAKHVAQPEYAARLQTQGRAGADATDDRAHALRHIGNIVSQPFSLLRFSHKWVRDRILARRKLPSVFVPTASRTYAMELNAEQIPDPASRIALGQGRDRYGMPLITLDWRPGQGTLDGIAASLALFRSAAAESGIGEFEYHEGDFESHLVPQGGHHIGTARMAATRDKGVVDTNGTVFGFPNLHIAGSSVFPTSGCANPTLLAVALSMRLADHILALEKTT